jgi:predicted RNase H-like nuclease (RuvC/YqgF family)
MQMMGKNMTEPDYKAITTALTELIQRKDGQINELQSSVDTLKGALSQKEQQCKDLDNMLVALQRKQNQTLSFGQQEDSEFLKRLREIDDMNKEAHRKAFRDAALENSSDFL